MHHVGGRSRLSVKELMVIGGRMGCLEFYFGWGGQKEEPKGDLALELAGEAQGGG